MRVQQTQPACHSIHYSNNESRKMNCLTSRVHQKRQNNKPHRLHSFMQNLFHIFTLFMQFIARKKRGTEEKKVKRQCCILKADRRLRFSLKPNTVDALPMILITTINYNIRIYCLTVTVEKSRNLHKVSVFIQNINSTLNKSKITFIRKTKRKAKKCKDRILWSHKHCFATRIV